MEVEVLATLLGVALAALVAACGAGFQLVNRRIDRLEDRFEERFGRLEDKFDRLEAKVDDLIMALARSGVLIDPQAASPGEAPPTSGSPSPTDQPSRSPPPEPLGPTAQPA